MKPLHQEILILFDCCKSKKVKSSDFFFLEKFYKDQNQERIMEKQSSKMPEDRLLEIVKKVPHFNWREAWKEVKEERKKERS